MTPEAIARAALAVIDRAGPAALTMRAVAAELDITPMALYRYVDDRDGLELLVVELVLGEVDVRPPARGDWRKKVAVLLERAREAVAEHPAVTPITLAHRHRSDGVRRLGEAILTVMAEAGFAGALRVIGFRTLSAYLIGALEAEHLSSLAGAGTAALAAQKDYPMLAETAARARTIGARQEFRGGLDIILAGLEATR